MRLSRKDFSNALICVFQLSLEVAVLSASQVYKCTIGDTAKILWLRSEREHLKEFRQYRAWKEEIPFAIINNGTQNARCLDDILKTFCLTKQNLRTSFPVIVIQPKITELLIIPRRPLGLQQFLLDDVFH
ncbi:uncharacterized protein LOC110043382 isoform X2 [Orbicella faveolata]|uniref:uncharacterized protein LOC110043382 isoform X2 n=1 Tax=Orbicella faveolata TaxID=48498 RepID=UPI0009E20346|nr:uncharacterized protein LOC110043382 isoform X2 [Orbicella faveolata]